MTARTYLNVPFSDKDEAKQLGARWDPEAKRWYVPENLSPASFERWAPTHNNLLLMLAPVWLLESESSCWKCQRRSPVFCLACSDVRDAQDDREGAYEDDEEVLLISDMASVDSRIQRWLRELAPDYRPDWSKTQDARVWMNHCAHCGAKMGDFYLHSEPGGAFFSVSNQQYARISQRLLTREGEYGFDGAYSL